jgi:hypothetical protein
MDRKHDVLGLRRGRRRQEAEAMVKLTPRNGLLTQMI